MKTFKLILLIISLTWLCSCKDTEADILSKMHTYQDSAGLAKARLYVIDMKEQSFRDSFSDKFPARVCDHKNPTDQLKYLEKEREAYHKMSLNILAYQLKIIPDKIKLEADRDMYLRKIDSLKLELKKY